MLTLTVSIKSFQDFHNEFSFNNIFYFILSIIYFLYLTKVILLGAIFYTEELFLPDSKRKFFFLQIVVAQIASGLIA